MYKNKKIIAIIPARGGSKGIKDKNIIDTCGHPLIYYTIDAALKSKYIDYVYVSTDSEKIKKIAIDCGAKVPFLREDQYAKDTSKTIDAVLYSLKKLNSYDLTFDYLVLLQPTSPLRKENDIDLAIEKIINSNFTSLVSVCELKDNPVLMRSINEDGSLKSILNQNSTLRRQDFQKYYRVNGAIYINLIKEINQETSFNDNQLGYIMDEKSSIDVDTYDDLEEVKKALEINFINKK